MIIVRSPFRISFGGGGTDMAAYYEKFGGAVVSTSINKYFYSFYSPRPDKNIQIISANLKSVLSVDDFYSLKFGEGFDIPAAVIKYFKIKNGLDLFLASEIPPGSGLGSSGALAVNLSYLCSLVKEKPLTKKQTAERAYFIEKKELGLFAGKQDQYASTFGGLNFIRFEKNQVSVKPLKIKKEIKKQLERNLLLFFTGQTRAANLILKDQDASAKRDEKKVVNAMHQVKENALEIKKALEQGKLGEFGKLLYEAWQRKKKMSGAITNPWLDKVYNLAINEGAVGGKLTGAGGGGYFVFYCEPKKQTALKRAMEKEGLKILNFKFEDQGVTNLINGI